MAAESPRIAELRRRVDADPSSIAFAQLAEEYRRAGNFKAAEQCCRTGLTRHPSYLSARVTLGRTLIELDKLEEAENELNFVLKSAPDNLAAIRGMAEIHQRRGDLELSLDFYRRAMPLARHDPEIEENVRKINRDLAASKPKDDPGLSFKEAQAEFLNALNQLPALQRPSPPSLATKSPASSGKGSPGTAAAVSAPQPVAPEPVVSPAPVRVPEPVARSVEPASAGSALPDTDNTGIDFDSLLKSLGVPDHPPPPIVEALLTEPAPPAARPEPMLPDLPLNVEQDDPFADLEKGLRDFDSPPSLAPESEASFGQASPGATPAASTEPLGYGEFSFDTAPSYSEVSPEPAIPYGERSREETPIALVSPPAPAPAVSASSRGPEDSEDASEQYILEELEAWLAAIKQ